MNIDFELAEKDVERIAKKLVTLMTGVIRESDEVVFNVDEVAIYLRVPRSKIYDMTRHNHIPYFKVGKYCRFRKSVIDNWSDGKVTYANPSSIFKKR